MPAGLPEAPRPGPQPLPGTLGWFPHPCPSVDAKGPESVCLLIEPWEYISPSPSLGSTISPLSSILWPKVQEQDTVQTLGAVRGLPLKESEFNTCLAKWLPRRPGQLPLLGSEQSLESLDSILKCSSRSSITFPTQSPTRTHRNQHRKTEFPRLLQPVIDRCFQDTGGGDKKPMSRVLSSICARLSPAALENSPESPRGCWGRRSG